MKTIAIVGSRRRDGEEDYAAVVSAFVEVYEVGDRIVSGHCPRGGDRFAELIAAEFDVPILLHLPDWNKYGRGAGIVRNTLIAQDADVVIACVAADRTGGTEDTVKKMLRMNKKVILV